MNAWSRLEPVLHRGIGGLCERLAANPGINNHQKFQLLGGCLDLTGEGSGSEAASYSSGSSGIGKLQSSSLPVFQDDLTSTAVGFSVATMVRAASRSFSHVLL